MRLSENTDVNATYSLVVQNVCKTFFFTKIALRKGIQLHSEKLLN